MNETRSHRRGLHCPLQSVAVRQVRGLEVAGILERRGARARSDFCREHHLGQARLYGSIAELARNVDVIALFVPNHCRVSVMEEVAAAVKAGARIKGVIVDKPLARNVQEARRMVELAREAKLLTAYFENQIFMKAIRTQREQLLPVLRTMGPLTLTRSAEEHGGPHEPWFWDPLRQGAACCSTWDATASQWAATCSHPRTRIFCSCSRFQ